MIVAAVLSLIAFAPQLPATPVTFSNPGQPLASLVPLLSKEAGVSLDVSAAMRLEVLAVHAEGVPLDQLLKRIATATEGTWSASGNSWTLVPDNNVRELARRHRRTERLKQFRKDIDEYLKPEPRGKDESDEEYEERAIPVESAALMRIVSQLDLGVLADMTEGQRLVFSTQPTRMQRAFSPNIAAIEVIVAEHNKIVAQANQRPRENPTEEQLARNPALRRIMANQRPTAINEAPAKVLLVAERSSEMYGGSSVSMTLKLYNREGKVVLRESTGLQGEEFDYGDWDEEEETDAKPAPKDDSPKLVLRPVGKELVKLAQGMEGMGMGGNMNFSDELRRIVARPHEAEPLAYMLGEYLIQVAKHKKTALVANLPDSAAELTYYVNESMTVNKFLEAFVDDGDLEVKEEDGVIAIRPLNGDACRSSRTDRVALGRLLASARGRSIPLVSLAEYATKAPAFTFDSLVPMLPLMLVAPGVLGSSYDPKAWQGLALYGSLTTPQRQGLDSSSQIPIGTLTPAQLGFANRLVYGADPAIMLDEDEPEEEEFGGVFGMMMGGYGGGGEDTDYRQEPTEVAPNGLIAGFLHAKVKSDIVFEPTSTSNSMMTMMMGLVGPEELVAMQMMLESAESAWAAYLPNLKEFRLGQRKMIDLRVQLAPTAFTRSILFDENVPQDGPKYTMETLPAEVKTRVDKAREEMKKMGGMGDLGTRRRRVPPP